MASSLGANPAVELHGAHADKIREATKRVLAICGRCRASSHQAAQQALNAEQRGDLDAFYAAGHILLNHEDQSRRGRTDRRPDQLTEWLSAYLKEHPEASTAEIVQAIERTAIGSHDVVADFDDDTLSYAPQAGAALKDISRNSLRRRIQRLKATRTS